MIFRKLSQTVDLSSVSRHCCLYCSIESIFIYVLCEKKICALNCLAQVCIILTLLDKAYLYFIPLTYLKIFLNWYLVNTIKISALRVYFFFHPCSSVSLPLFQDFITDRVTVYFFFSFFKLFQWFTYFYFICNDVLPACMTVWGFWIP